MSVGAHEGIGDHNGGKTGHVLEVVVDRESAALIPTSVLVNVIDVADRAGLPTEQWLAAAGLTAATLNSPETRVSFRQAALVLRRAVRAMPDRGLGIDVGNPHIVVAIAGAVSVQVPLTADQRVVADLWRSLLKVEQPAADDDFFSLGGHSLLAAKLMAALAEAFAVETSVHDIYEYPTLGALAQALAQRRDRQPTQRQGEARALQDDVYLPSDLVIDPTFDPRQISAPRAILLTGATGFVGAHLLADLLRTTDAELYCLVRDGAKLPPRQRLEAVLQRSFLFRCG